MDLLPYLIISMIVTGIGAVIIFRALGLMPPLRQQWIRWRYKREIERESDAFFEALKVGGTKEIDSMILMDISVADAAARVAEELCAVCGKPCQNNLRCGECESD